MTSIGAERRCPSLELRHSLEKKHFEPRNRPTASRLRIGEQLGVAGIVDNVHDSQARMKILSRHTALTDLWGHADRGAVNQHPASGSTAFKQASSR